MKRRGKEVLWIAHRDKFRLVDVIKTIKTENSLDWAVFASMG